MHIESPPPTEICGGMFMILSETMSPTEAPAPDSSDSSADSFGRSESEQARNRKAPTERPRGDAWSDEWRVVVPMRGTSSNTVGRYVGNRVARWAIS